MNDFLSKFSGKNYDKILDDQPLAESQPAPTEKEEAPRKESSQPTARRRRSDSSASRSVRREELAEEMEIDPHYKKNQRKKWAMIASSALLTLVLAAWLIYQFTHVSLPNFVGQPLTDARKWATENQVTIDLKQEYSDTVEVNTVISQDKKAGSKLAKGGTLTVTSSLGADPEEIISLPDFSSMTFSQAQKWIEEHKAENLKLVQEYSDTIEKGQFIKLDIANNIPAEEYKRSNKASLYYSRGKEILEANIEVPNFKDKPKADVESWAKTNSITVTYQDKASSTVATGLVLDQSIEAGQKIAKKSTMTVAISAGKGVTVPNFNHINASQAGSVSGLTVIVRFVYSELPYGHLISQSQEAGTELTEKDDRNVEVVYSAGIPYLRDLRGKNEGDLQQYFYDQFRSKGADIYYTTYYVNSDQAKGTVVQQSVYETELPLSYTVELGISNGAWYSGQTPPSSSDDSSHSQTETGSNP